MSKKALTIAAEPECPMCGGKGGWPGLDRWIICVPCKGDGKTKKE